MKCKRLFAGIAAAATMLGGLAVGAMGANAADAQTITITNVRDGMTFNAYQLATFSDVQGADGRISSLQLETNAEAAGALGEAMTQIGQAPADPYRENPAAQAAKFDDGLLRQLADKLKDRTDRLGQAYSSGAVADESTTVTVPAAGWYLVTSPTESVAPAIVASTVSGFTTIDRNNPAITTMDLGKLVAKHNLTPTPDKTVDKGGKNVVGVGDTLNYEIKTTLPSRQANTEPIAFRVHDRPSTGLSVRSSDITVKVGGAELAASDYKLEGFGDDGAFRGDGQRHFTVNLDDYANSAVGERHAGERVVISYKATVNDDAKTDPVTNYVAVTTTPTDEVDFRKKTEDIPVGRFEFKKIGVDAQATGLAGASFQVRNAEDAVLAFRNDGDGVYAYAPDGGAGTVDTIVSGANGLVKVTGLPQGTYQVTETKAPEGYSEQFRPTFRITVDGDADGAAWSLASGSNALGLASGGARNDITVKNVKAVTQLPMTGAAGIALLVVVALLVGGAGVLIAVRASSLKRQLRA